MKRPIFTLVALLISVVVLLLMKKRISSLIQAMKNRRAHKKEQKLLDELGVIPSFSAVVYQNLANELKQVVTWSWYAPNCDETATQRALKKLVNDRDYIELALAFGIKDSWTMENWIQSCLNQSEKNFINQYWSSKGMITRI